MADRTVSVKLEADIASYQSSMVKAAASTKALGATVDDEARGMEKALGDAGAKGVDRLVRDANGKLRNSRGQFATEAEKIAAGFGDELGKGGENGGGLLARGISNGVMRNSPLIVAAVGAGLAFGAPAMIAGAGVLFAGLGAAAAAQTEEVRSAWSNLGADIKAGAAEDAAVLVPVFVGAADKIGAAYARLRPEIQDAFAASAPLVESFTDSLTRAAENAMPGLVRAIEAGGPVMDGLGSLLEDVGQGVSDFFDAVNEHGPAAGAAFGALGDILGSALPLIGEFAGTGTELASVILPPVADALEAVTGIIQTLGPLLPAIVAGFAGMKIASSLSEGLGNMSGRLSTIAQNAAMATYNVDGFAGTVAGKASGAASRASDSFRSMSDNVGKASAALPALGIVIGGIASDLSDASSEEDKWTQAILAGGDAATAAYAQYKDGTHFGQAIDEATGLASSWDDAKAKANELKDSMSPLELAQSNVTAAQNALRAEVDKYGPSSQQAKDASVAYKDAQAEVERQEGETELAISGVTTAMIDQYNQALAATNSAFGYRDAQNAVEDAQAALLETQSHLNDSNADTRTSTEDVARAGLGLEEALLRQATAAGQLASDALPATASELDHNTASAQGTLAELYKMRDQMGTAFPASLQTTITNLENTGVKVDTASGQFSNLRDSVNNVPTFHNISVDADLGPAETKLENFLNKHYTAIIGSTVEGQGSSGSGGKNFRLASGGYVSGPGTSTSDSIPAMLSDGEFVINAAATRANRPLIEAINSGRKFASGGLVSRDSVDVHYDMDMSGAEASMSNLIASASAAGASGPIGNGAVGGSWQALWAKVHAAFPTARKTSDYRPGDPGYHGKGKAVDVAGARPGDAAAMAAINRWAAAAMGANLSQLIYTPGINLLNGRPHMYNAATRADHYDHVHMAAYRQGTPYVPEDGPAYLHKGEAVIPASINSREFSGMALSGVGGGSSTNNSRQIVNHITAGPTALEIARAVVDAQRTQEFLHG